MKKSNFLYTLFLSALLAFTFIQGGNDEAEARMMDNCNGTMCTQVNCAFFGLLCDGVCSPLSNYGDCEYTSPNGTCQDTGCMYPASY